MQPEPLSGPLAAQALQQFRAGSPLVHCMTNDVVQTFTANVLLALGASPAMVIDKEEAAQFSARADALLINLGTLTQESLRAMRAAVLSARCADKPWLLDPVAVGGLTLRTEFARELLALRPTAIRGNASEIMALAGESGGGRGVDSTIEVCEALPAARSLAKTWGTVVAVSGETDYLTDGERAISVHGGHPIMTRVVGSGCALSAVMAACCALPGSVLTNAAAACAWMARAGEHAEAKSAGPGSFIPAFLDALWHLNQESLI